MKRQLGIWVVLAVIGYGFALLFVLADSGSKAEGITAEGIQGLIDGNKTAAYTISEYRSGHRHLGIKVGDNGGYTKYSAPLDDPLMAVLTKNNIKYFTSIEGRDFHKWGLFGRLLPFVFVVIIVAGVITLIRLPRDRKGLTPQAC